MILAGTAAVMMFAWLGQDTPRTPRQGGPVSVRQQIIIRVPRGVRRVTPTGTSLIRWQESRGPRCVSATSIVGATLLSQNSVDLILRDSSRVRARLQRRCPSLDYYYGFYVNATRDGQICAERDFVRSRAGGECQIDQFRTLRPARP